ncbi:MAG TPA: beta-N-acetylhexosaminidase [Bacillota bacterium]
MGTSLLKKIGQLFIIGFAGKTVPYEVKQCIHTYHVGGIILFSRNIGTPEETLALTTELQREAKRANYEYPLFICVDQENGVVRRLGKGTTILPGAMMLGATNDVKAAYEIGQITGKELKSLGINWNLAPVLDVNNNPNNRVIGVRSFGECPEKVSQFGKAMMAGMQSERLMTTLKHFPGHGDTHVDSHVNLPVIPHDIERLKEVELKPFQTCMKAGADVIMTAHISFPALEKKRDVPATVSKAVITGLLREELRYKGVVMTDCLEMEAIASEIGTEQGAMQAIQAGVDLVTISHSFDKQVRSIQNVYEAVKNGDLTEEVIERSTNRIRMLKETYLQWEDLHRERDDPLTIVGCKEHREIARKVYKKGVTIVDEKKMLPIYQNSSGGIAILELENDIFTQVEDQRPSDVSLGKVISTYVRSAETYRSSNMLTRCEVSELVNKLKTFDIVMIGVLTGSSARMLRQLIEQLENERVSVIIIALKSPYVVVDLPRASAYIYTYEYTYPALTVAIAAVFGKEQVYGQLPIKISIQ